MQAHEVAQATNKPFHGRMLPKAKKDAVKRQHLTPADVVRLMGSCGKDQPLADLITLGAYTGARIEELCNLMAVTMNIGPLVLTNIGPPPGV